MNKAKAKPITIPREATKNLLPSLLIPKDANTPIAREISIEYPFENLKVS